MSEVLVNEQPVALNSGHKTWSDVLASVARPVQELRGFQRVRLAPGETQRITMVLKASSLAFRDASGRRVVEDGATRIMVGSSSRDIRLRGFLQVKRPF